MQMEDDVYGNYTFDEEKLRAYGFLAEGGKLIYEKALPEKNLKVVLTYVGTTSGKIMDTDTDEAYANFRRENATGFSAGVRQQFLELLLDIRDKCCQNQYFRSEQARRINRYISAAYGGVPDFLWPNIPSYGAYRRKGSKKWYAVIGSVSRSKLDRAANPRGEVEVINVKADSDTVKALLTQKGYYPAFHMNKKCWVSIILDDTLDDTEIYRLIDGSYASV